MGGWGALVSCCCNYIIAGFAAPRPLTQLFHENINFIVSFEIMRSLSGNKRPADGPGSGRGCVPRALVHTYCLRMALTDSGHLRLNCSLSCLALKMSAFWKCLLYLTGSADDLWPTVNIRCAALVFFFFTYILKCFNPTLYKDLPILYSALVCL